MSSSTISRVGRHHTIANGILLQGHLAYVAAIITQTGGKPRFAYEEFFKSTTLGEASTP